MQAGVDAIQLRERHLNDDDYLLIARRLMQVKPTTTKLILNRRAHLVEELGADGVHMGFEQIDYLPRLRGALPPATLIGVSCHSVSEVERAAAAGASFATLSPVFPTDSKPEYRNFIGIDELTCAQRQSTLPIFALGGIDQTNLGQLIARGIVQIACIRSVLSKPVDEVATAVQTMREMVGAAAAK